MARRAGFVVPQAEEVLPAPLTAGTVCVIPAVGTVAAVARGTVEFRVKVAFLRSATAVTGCQARHTRMSDPCTLKNGILFCFVVLGIEPRDLCMLGKHSTN